MKHKYIKKNKHRLMILFHGTGGDENSLISIAENLDNDSSILALRGNVNENGLNRFFKRLGVGVLDFDNLKSETDNLNNFLNDFFVKNNLENVFVTLLGYSNGANMIGSLLLNKPNLLVQAAILLRPMLMVKDPININLNNLPVYVSSGKFDQLVKINESKELSELFTKSNAKIESKIYNCGHELSYEELADIRLWYEGLRDKQSV
ncbi:MAG: dienelactone hydrolase family protein [Candidatus Izemoplasmatales bacterium]